ncbi:MAG: 30S ribosomal protein S4 [Alphaproteobacteria bacterium GM7ARS4]|nr:30S ribosomal protein S4 [Alphaproteobacteria bacterium GM7ARS4]
MTKRVKAKHKIERKLRAHLWGHAKSPVLKREYGPGQHGQSRTRRNPSDYGNQLLAKQRLKGFYANITEHQFRNIYEEAARKKGDTGENFIGLLESRLDAALLRMQFVPSPYAARQLISHGHVLVNERRVTIPSYRLKEADVVSIKTESRQIPMIMDCVGRDHVIPDYIIVDFNRLKGTFLRVPTLAETPYPVDMEPALVVEYYSR